jgi:uncharacterized protein (DUF983 family)
MSKLKEVLNLIIGLIIIVGFMYGMQYLSERFFWVGMAIVIIGVILFLTQLYQEIRNDLNANKYQKSLKKREEENNKPSI